MSQYRRILVPLDGSELAERPLATAAELAGRCGAELLLVTVLKDTETWGNGAPGLEDLGRRGPKVQVLSGVVERTERYLAQAAARLHTAVPSETRVQIGDPANEIVELARREDADLIVIATRGRSGLVRGLLGSVTDRVLRSATAPALVMRSEIAPPVPAALAPWQTIIVPLDGSPAAESAIPHAAAIANLYRSRVLLARVGMLAEARAYLEDVAGRPELQLLELGLHASEGVPRAVIAGLAEREERSLIVMTTRGQSGFGRWMLGSVADGLVRTAAVPTLVVPPAHSGSR